MSPVPTPADVFRRHPRPPAPARSPLAPEPHDPATDEPYRALWERGIVATRLIPHTRFVALALATHAEWATGRIPEDAQPRLGRLVDLTGLDAGLVVVSLNILESRGWIRRDAKSRRWTVATIRLSVPGPIMRRLKKSGAQTPVRT
ncbi:hypothetical protein [Streptomyces sp. NPDC057854]|uniref:hypothetical protein n=1 Tax=unclassified Streptomyces TaxID=2593676 RepID=UPI00369545A4